MLLTSRTRAEGLASAERLGFATCLVKPQRRHQLAQALIATMEAVAAGRAVVPPPSLQAAMTRVVPPSPLPTPSTAARRPGAAGCASWSPRTTR